MAAGHRGPGACWAWLQPRLLRGRCLRAGSVPVPPRLCVAPDGARARTAAPRRGRRAAAAPPIRRVAAGPAGSLGTAAAGAGAAGATTVWRPPSRVPTPDLPGYAVVHADAQLLVVDKAAGLLTVPAVTQQDCLQRRLAAGGWPCTVVHRLDRDTSGLLVLALDPATHRALSAQFQRREVAKVYSAVVAGCPAQDRGEIALPIRKDLVNTPLQMVDHERGKPSVTQWRVLERLRDRTRLELTPLTGRTHQLRLHLLSIGHPICGDDLYAPDDLVLRMAPRLCLHAETLAFVHPTTQERLAFRSAAAEQF